MAEMGVSYVLFTLFFFQYVIINILSFLYMYICLQLLILLLTSNRPRAVVLLSSEPRAAIEKVKLCKLIPRRFASRPSRVLSNCDSKE